MNIKRDEKGRIYYDRPAELAEKPIPVRFPIEVDRLLREMKDRSAYIRSAVVAQMKGDGLLAEGDRPQD